LLKALLAVGSALVLVIAVLLARTLTLTAPEVTGGSGGGIPVDAERIATHMSEAIRFQTISRQAPQTSDPAPMEAFIAWVERTYPRIGTELRREHVADYSLLYTWKGSDESLRPILLAAHYDVVPVIPGTEDLWEHPPFGGEISDGYVWGRGALDDKSAVIAQLEAVTLLLEAGFRPARTVYLSFGHDEEIGGGAGAAGVTELLRSRGVRLEWSLDEGSFLIDGVFPGVEDPVASINVAEKGYVSIELIARGEGGHSSMPPRETAVGILAAAIVKLQENPLPGGIEGLVAESFDALAPHMPFLPRLLLGNRWLFGGLLESILSQNAATNAMMRTTTAPTMLSGSVKENVLPIEAVGRVNFRLHPRDTPEGVAEFVTGVVDDQRVEVKLRRGGSASQVSSTQSDGFRDIGDSVRDVIGAAIVIPGLTVGGTDSRHYGQIAEDAYRFNPMIVTSEDISGFHGTNERISIENLVRGTRIYARLITRAAGSSHSPGGSESRANSFSRSASSSVSRSSSSCAPSYMTRRLWSRMARARLKARSTSERVARSISRAVSSL
jgi:carboxypeptidase PM20D1